MKDINDVRKALWKAYVSSAKAGTLEGKMNEAYTELVFPNFYDCKNEEDFLTPTGINIYSYALGPGRMHHIIKAEKESRPNYYTWNSPDIFAKAVEVIEEWERCNLRTTEE